MYRIFMSLDEDGRKWEVYGTTVQSGRTYSFTTYETDSETEVAATMLELSAQYGTANLLVANIADYDLAVTVTADNVCDCDPPATNEEVREMLNDVFIGEKPEDFSGTAVLVCEESATDDEVAEVIEEIFGEEHPVSPYGTVKDGPTATDEDIDEMLKAVFRKRAKHKMEDKLVARNEDIDEMLAELFD